MSFAKQGYFDRETSNLPISKFRFVKIGKAAKLIDQLEQLFPFTKDFWAVDRTKNSPYIIIYLDHKLLRESTPNPADNFGKS